MNQLQRATRARTVGTAAALAVSVAASCTACNGSDGPSEREYAVPDTFCGLDVPQRLYDPLFPSGSDLSTPDMFPKPPRQLSTLDQCTFELDGDYIAWVVTSGYDSLESYMGAIGTMGDRNTPLDYEMADGTRVAGEFEAMAWPGLAIAGTSCEPGEAIHSFTVGIQTRHSGDDEESVRVLSELIQPFMNATVEQSICTPGLNEGSEYSDAYQD